VSELRDRGYEAARAAGITKPRADQAIHYGLVSFAKDDPLSITDDKVPPLIRASLFDVDTSELTLDPEVLAIVYERVFDAFMNHTGDTTAAFNAWFSGRNNSFVKQIAKQQRARGGGLEPDLVRRALLRLGWDAYQYVADGLSTQMQAVANALPEPLTGGERQIFAEMHLRQPHYGSLPLLLLGERIGFVESVVRDICNNPGDRHPVEVLHRLLQFYAVMALERREADRERKRKEGLVYDDGRDARPSKGQDAFSRIAAHILAEKDESCACAAPDWVAELKDTCNDPITFSAICTRCNEHREVSLSAGEFTDYGWESRHPDA
jgi:hypothetical protein